jgi:hypothetical protein
LFFCFFFNEPQNNLISTEIILVGGDDLDELAIEPESRKAIKLIPSPDEFAEATDEIQQILSHGRPLPSRRLSDGETVGVTSKDIEGESSSTDILCTSKTPDPIAEAAEFENSLRKRMEERQKILESRSKRLELEEGFERLRHRAFGDTPIQISKGISETAFDEHFLPKSEPAPIPLVAPQFDSKVDDSDAKKPSFFDKLAAVFKSKD